jgi:hypothetical protein
MQQKLKATKLMVLEFIRRREAVSIHDLMRLLGCT